MAAKIILSGRRLTSPNSQLRHSMPGRKSQSDTMVQWNTHGQQTILPAEVDSGIATGKSWREIGAALCKIVKGWECER